MIQWSLAIIITRMKKKITLFDYIHCQIYRDVVIVVDVVVTDEGVGGSWDGDVHDDDDDDDFEVEAVLVKVAMTVVAMVMFVVKRLCWWWWWFGDDDDDDDGGSGGCVDEGSCYDDSDDGGVGDCNVGDGNDVVNGDDNENNNKRIIVVIVVVIVGGGGCGGDGEVFKLFVIYSRSNINNKALHAHTGGVQRIWQNLLPLDLLWNLSVSTDGKIGKKRCSYLF